MIIVAIIAILTAIVIPNYLTARRTANDAAAKKNLQSMMTAAEVHFSARVVYPASVSDLGDFFSGAAGYCADAAGGATLVQGFTYTCVMSASGYTFVARPAAQGLTGTITYTATTGAVLTPL